MGWGGYPTHGRIRQNPLPLPTKCQHIINCKTQKYVQVLAITLEDKNYLNLKSTYAIFKEF